MVRGIVILTGTHEIGSEYVRRLLPAVFRRVHREASLSWMSTEDLCHYLRSFLAQFVPDCTAPEWAGLARAFACEESPWVGSRQISVDMIKQFLMHEITEASCLGLGNFLPSWRTASGDFQIQPERRSEFFSQIGAAERAAAFLQSYARVDGDPRASLARARTSGETVQG